MRGDSLHEGLTFFHKNKGHRKALILLEIDGLFFILTFSLLQYLSKSFWTSTVAHVQLFWHLLIPILSDERGAWLQRICFRGSYCIYTYRNGRIAYLSMCGFSANCASGTADSWIFWFVSFAIISVLLLATVMIFWSLVLCMWWLMLAFQCFHLWLWAPVSFCL